MRMMATAWGIVLISWEFCLYHGNCVHAMGIVTISWKGNNAGILTRIILSQYIDIDVI